MAFGRGAAPSGQDGNDAAERTVRSQLAAAADIGSSWSAPEPEPRDWKKLALVVGLGVLSWVATYVGMLELIEANMGDLPILHKIIIAFSVAMLMIMVVWLLDQLFAPNPLFTKLIYAVGYVFLTLISIGFGFGFYWKVLESRSESSRSAESAVTQVQSSLHAASTRLEQLSATLIQLTQVSSTQSDVERAKGTSCPNSKPGDGPRRKLREDDAARFTFASEFVKGRVGQVKTELGALDGDLAKIASNDASLVDAKSGTRNEFMKGLGRKLDLTVTGFNAFRTDPQLRQIRTDLAERAEKTTFADTKGGTFACPDPQLQTALRGVVRAIDQLPDLEKPKIAAVEGSEATIEAFRRLTATFAGLLSFKLPPSADELRDLQKKAVQSVETPAAAQRAILSEAVGLSKRDYIPLAIAAFVDFCLLLVSMGRPANRLGSLVSKMREAEKGPVIQILSRFNDIHRDPAIRQNFELFRHVVFDFNGAYYVAVPLDAPYRFKKAHGGHSIGMAQVEELQQEAHLLANLFASFEKEKIFSRVYTPLLSTKAIQKKLWRQGSKFAGCEAFRIYRFKDGAWSELILGAVMGAARRVEIEKRQRRIEDEVSRTFGRPVTHPAAMPAAAPFAAQPSMGAYAHHAQANGHANAPYGYRRPAAPRPYAVDQPADARPVARTAGAWAPGARTPGAWTEPDPTTQASGQDNRGSVHDADKWGPYAPYATTPIPADLVRGSGTAAAPHQPRLNPAANGNTAPADRAGPAADRASASADRPAEPLPANVTPLPNIAVRPQGVLQPSGGAPAPSSAPSAVSAASAPSNSVAATHAAGWMPSSDETRIVMSRTETISIPATAASLPPSLVATAFGRGFPVGGTAAAAAAPAIDLTPAAANDSVRSAVAAPRLIDARAEPATEIVTAEDIQTLRRFAPGAAE